MLYHNVVKEMCREDGLNLMSNEEKIDKLGDSLVEVLKIMEDLYPYDGAHLATLPRHELLDALYQIWSESCAVLLSMGKLIFES